MVALWLPGPYARGMPTTLRHISIHVEETSPSAFHWVLNEREDGDRWNEIAKSDSAARSYKDAMAKGLAALQALVEDLDVGPRRPGKLRSDSAREPAKRRQAPPEEVVPSKPRESDSPAPFGFGPAV